MLLGAFSLAPTAGDVGGCGQDPIELTPSSFASIKKDVDCTRCKGCSLATQRCQDACNVAKAPDTIPATCHPFVHDGDVCLRALQAASCGDYAEYVRDDVSRVPSECQFCRPVIPGPTLGGDGGAQ